MLLTISGYNPDTKITYLSHNEPLASIWAGNFHLDEHALGIAGHQLAGGGMGVVAQQDRGLLRAQILDEKLAVGAFERADFLFVGAGPAVFAVGTSRVMRRQADGGELVDFGQQASGATAQGQEADLA
jgi:hypothetical protein